ncbi:YcdB/YcdC domain-containing protein [Aneurinibacillus aneurinilyticus]|uniref:YcdB/YcdC domain-containing protein n=1 Tax=Aneurinibacillus aneurinilyticus TaxID=1391 RepID=UPI0023F0E24E|nr:YcdB/YcdC domain-containing protein [Aneurinibacillus aneurinilyticus]
MRKQTKKKWAGSMLAAAIVAGGILPYNVFADEAKATPQASVQAVKTTKIDREEALRIAQEFMPIPAGYTNNQVEMEDNKYIGRTLWRLTWGMQQSGDDYGQLSISIDAKDGTILNVNHWSRESERSNLLPGKLDTTSLVNQANALINKHYAKYASQLKFSEESLESFKRGSASYMDNSLYFIRLQNGIPVTDQGLRISYDRNGKIRSVDFSWDEVQFDSISNVKNKEEILHQVERELEMELAYLSNTSQPGGKIELAYAPKLKTSSDLYNVVPGFLIDAKTGKQISGIDGKEVNTSVDINRPLSTAKTTPPPNVNMDEAHAIAKIKEFGILKNSMRIEQKGYREENYPVKRKVWEVYAVETEGERKQVRASLDAQTGELVNYSQYGMSYNEKMENPDKIKMNISGQQAEKTAEAFIRKVLPERLNKLYAVEATPNYYNGDTEKILNYNVAFIRKENETRVVGEGATVNVDADTGEITDYNMTWSSQALPAIANVIKPEEAKKKAMALMEAELRYNLIPPYGPGETGKGRKAKPVYVLAVKANGRPYDYGTSYLDARTGEWKTYGNLPVNNSGQPVSDIAGHPLQKELQAMIDANLLEVKGGQLNPDQKLTRGEAIKIFYTVARQPYEYYGPGQESFFTDVDDNDEIKQAAEWALQNRLLPRNVKQLRPNEPATREFLAELIVRGLGYDKLAAKEGIFETKFQDEAIIKKKGEAALVTRLQVMTPNSKNEFEPARQVTKAETAVAVYRYLHIKESFME